MARVIIPTPLRKFTENQSTLETSGGTILESIQDLTSHYPSLKNHIFDNQGKIRSFVRIFLGDEDIKVLDNESTLVEEDSVISIIPAIAGGAK